MLLESAPAAARGSPGARGALSPRAAISAKRSTGSAALRRRAGTLAKRAPSGQLDFLAQGVSTARPTRSAPNPPMWSSRASGWSSDDDRPVPRADPKRRVAMEIGARLDARAVLALGAGKTTISRKLLAIERERMLLSVSVTTRKPRPASRGAGLLFPATRRSSPPWPRTTNCSSTRPSSAIATARRAPRSRRRSPRASSLVRYRLAGNAAVAREGPRRRSSQRFVLPPDMEALEKRLRQRAQDSEDVVQGGWPRRPMKEPLGRIRHIVVNHDIEASTGRCTASSPRAPEARPPDGLGDFVRGLMRKG